MTTDIQRLAAHFGDLKPLRVLIVTLSDRAHKGEYEDKSGPRAQERMQEFVDAHNIEHAIARLVLPDDPAQLERVLTSARDGATHLVITTGGTGVGPRDITPEVVHHLADRTIPGVMDAIRLKYGAEKPLALLSRSIAAILGETLVYTLPGSVKAVDEYLDELLKTLPHTLCVIHSIERH